MSAPRIIEQHDYVSVDFGNGRRLTASFSGEKASGAVPMEVFDRWSAAIRGVTEGKTLGQAIREFVANIDTIWPAWSAPPAKVYSPEEEVSFDFGKRRGGVKKGRIVKKTRTGYQIRFEGMGLVSMSADLLISGGHS